MRREAFDYLWAEHDLLWTQFCALQTEHEVLVAAAGVQLACVRPATWAAHHSRVHDYRLLVANHRLALQLSTRGWDGVGAVEPVRARSPLNRATPHRLAAPMTFAE